MSQGPLFCLEHKDRVDFTLFRCNLTLSVEQSNSVAIPFLILINF